MFSIWLSVRGTKTSAGQAIWHQSFDKRQKNNAFWAHENNNISQRLSTERESKMRMRHVQKVYSGKIKSTASFNAGVFWKVDTVSGSKSLTFLLLQMAKNLVNTIRPRSKESLYLLSFLVF